MPLTEEQLKIIEEKLLARKNNLESQLEKINEGLDFGSDVDHGEEEADETEELANRLDVQYTLQKELEKINKALTKIKKGEYGKCERCGKEISFKLLKVAPESELCRRCKWLNKISQLIKK